MQTPNETEAPGTYQAYDFFGVTAFIWEPKKPKTEETLKGQKQLPLEERAA